jgi:hypothetical protein
MQNLYNKITFNFLWENIEKRWVGEEFERLWVENFRISSNDIPVFE